MRFFGRQDLLLIAALTTALVIVFSSSISRVARLCARDRAAERTDADAGSRAADRRLLLPSVPPAATQQQAKAEAAELADQEAEHRAEELERLVAFGHALARSLDFDSIRVAITQHLPAIAGTDRSGCWCSKAPSGRRSRATRAVRRMCCSGAISPNSCCRADPTDDGRIQAAARSRRSGFR